MVFPAVSSLTGDGPLMICGGLRCSFIPACAILVGSIEWVNLETLTSVQNISSNSAQFYNKDILILNSF